MSTRIRTTRLLAGVAGVAFTTTLLAPPAAAEVKAFTDATGDGSNGAGSGGPNTWGDIAKVRVKHGPEKLRITVRLAENGEHPDFYDLWVDTDADDPGPELVVGVSMEVFPATGVAATESFGEYGDTTCSARSAVKTKRTMKVTFHRRCFDFPDRVRVSAQTSMEYENADWAPGRKKFGPWVSAG